MVQNIYLRDPKNESERLLLITIQLFLLSSPQNLNFTGFRKILKKHDKILETSRGADWRVAHVEVAPFYTCKKITQLISETEVRMEQKPLVVDVKALFRLMFILDNSVYSIICFNHKIANSGKIGSWSLTFAL